MNVFYNLKGIGDTLLIAIRDCEHPTFERKGDVARIFDEKTKETQAVLTSFMLLSMCKWKLMVKWN